MVPLALECLQSLELRHVRRRQRTNGRDEIACRDVFALIGMHPPQICAFVEFGAGHARVELDVPLQVMALGHMLEVAQDFRLLGIALGPFPLLQQLLVPGEAIDVGVRIATRAGIAVPVPGAPDGFARFIDPHLQSQFVPQRLQHVHAGEACTDHDGVKVLSCARHFSSDQRGRASGITRQITAGRVLWPDRSAEIETHIQGEDHVNNHRNVEWSRHQRQRRCHRCIPRQHPRRARPQRQPELRNRPTGVERQHRPATGADRALHRASRRSARRRFRANARASALTSRRRAQRPGLRHER